MRQFAQYRTKELGATGICGEVRVTSTLDVYRQINRHRLLKPTLPIVINNGDCKYPTMGSVCVYYLQTNNEKAMENFFHLRLSPKAQEDCRQIAESIKKVYEENK